MSISMNNYKILVVDDEKSILFSLKAALTKEGYLVKTFDDPVEALKVIEPGLFHVVISDYNMPQMNGIEFMKKAKQLDQDLVFILMTAYGSEKLAIEAMKEGAYDYFSKPFDIDEMRVVVAKACERFELAWEKKNLAERFLVDPEEDKILGISEPMQMVKERIEQVAKSDVTVLIQGESGTGKELVAEAIQRRSLRASGPFIKVNCAAIPENLIESELFGYEKGAFTGAISRKKGKFELANGGTLFLDEIGDMSLATQAKVLRAIQHKEIERLGGSEPIKIDVRIISATHKDLKKLIEQKQFREDLFYRINVVTINIPPLRERPQDIPVLVEHFLKIASQKIGRTIKSVTSKALEALKKYHWPGNVRQLQNIIEGAAVFAKDNIIDLHHLPDEVKIGLNLEPSYSSINWILQEIENGKSLEDVISNIEKEVISRVLLETNGNQSQAASKLKMKRGTLQYKMKIYNIS